MKLDSKTKRTAANSWIERTNPLRGLTIAQAKGIYDVARAHGSPLLQKIYDEIESSDPVLMTCVERRGAALAQLGWKITAKPGFDDAVAERHKDFLDRAVRSIDNLDSAIEHLDLAFFRGFSFVQPIWSANGTVCHISLLNSWNFLRDDDGHYMWNPDASTDPTKCVPISPAMRVVSVVRHRAIDWPALSIHIRKYLGERDWGRFIERYGIPPVDVVMAPNATETQRDDYVKAADDARDGVSTVWPSGSITSRAEGARGQDPFTAFIEHQEKLIVLAATGGTLTSLAQADTGSLAGGAQMDVWRQIVARDAVIISEALQRNLFDLILREAFPNEEPAAEFSLGTEEQLSANEAADLAGKLKVAGYTVAQDELEESVGYTLAPVPEAQPQIPSLFPNRVITNREGEVVVGSGSGRKEDNPPLSTSTSSLLSSFASDNSKLADAINLFLKDPNPEDAQDLIDALPDLVPDDPALAAVIAEEMAKAMRPDASAPSDAELANTERVPSGNGNGGQFTGATNHPRGKEPETKAQHDRYGSTDTEKLTADPKKNAERGMAAIKDVMRKRSGFVDEAMYRPEVGWIRFEWGDAGNPKPDEKGVTFRGGHGLSHIAAKHEKDLKDLPSILSNGDIFKHEDPEKLYVLHGDKFAVLRKLGKGHKVAITEFNSKNDRRQIEFIKKQPRAAKPGEN